uniref:Putative ovule protein n=1 Tax=Solanum chacoense TaxID=4108 RepID=A0A0V0HTX5_SOLCH
MTCSPCVPFTSSSSSSFLFPTFGSCCSLANVFLVLVVFLLYCWNCTLLFSTFFCFDKFICWCLIAHLLLFVHFSIPYFLLQLPFAFT